MAIVWRMPDCAALARKGIADAIERERATVERMVLSVIWGCDPFP